MQTAPPAAPKKRSKLILAVVGLVGLLLTCFCVGTMSAIAIPAFRSYVMRSKTMEAGAELQSIAAAEKAYCTEHGNYLVPAGPVPTIPSQNKQSGDFAADPAFAQLGYAPFGPVYYSYSVRHDPTVTGGIELVAQGDLDGNGIFSTYTLRCDSACECASTPVVDSALE